MDIKGDKLTSILGLLAAGLVVQQNYAPELLSKEEAAPILALLVGSYGIATNKENVHIPLSGNGEKKKKICELEAQIEELKKELEEIEISKSESKFPEKKDPM